jgi:hypothetical protein
VSTGRKTDGRSPRDRGEAESDESTMGRGRLVRAWAPGERSPPPAAAGGPPADGGWGVRKSARKRRIEERWAVARGVLSSAPWVERTLPAARERSHAVACAVPASSWVACGWLDRDGIERPPEQHVDEVRDRFAVEPVGFFAVDRFRPDEGWVLRACAGHPARANQCSKKPRSHGAGGALDALPTSSR